MFVKPNCNNSQKDIILKFRRKKVLVQTIYIQVYIKLKYIASQMQVIH